MNLKTQPLCTNPHAEGCTHYPNLLYRSMGAIMQLPDGYDPAPCDFCVWKLREVDFFTMKEY